MYSLKTEFGWCTAKEGCSLFLLSNARRGQADFKNGYNDNKLEKSKYSTGACRIQSRHDASDVVKLGHSMSFSGDC